MTAPKQGAGAPTAPLRWLAGSWTLAAWLWAAAIVWAPTGAVRLDVASASASAQASVGARVGRAALVSIYAAGARVCHQRAERSFHRHGVQFPVCARCTGIYFSLGVGVLLGWWRRPSHLPRPHRVRWAIAAAAVPIAVSLAVEWTGLSGPGNVARAVSAIPIGLYLGWLAIALLAPRSALGHQTPSIAGQTL
jgi:uncharacterized membrane protein